MHINLSSIVLSLTIPTKIRPQPTEGIFCNFSQVALNRAAVDT